MDCKTAEKTIPYFLQDELDGTELAEFVEHIEGCPECREELTIQFLVAEGIGQLEKGDSFNLQNALYEKMDSAKQKVRIHQTLKYTLFCLEAAVAAEIIIALCVVFRFL
jgi:predicted anti-sigma-YlaC factor YlaD